VTAIAPPQPGKKIGLYLCYQVDLFARARYVWLLAAIPGPSAL